MRRATRKFCSTLHLLTDFNPRSPWGERHGLPRSGHDLLISIHALHEESDIGIRSQFLFSSNFNPRSPWGERHSARTIRNTSTTFQSTLSMRRATTDMTATSATTAFQSTLSMRRATFIPNYLISSDFVFQSTLSMRRATLRQPLSLHSTLISIHALHEESDVAEHGQRVAVAISIHALHEESDPKPTSSPRRILYFNPRSPWGERLRCTS